MELKVEQKTAIKSLLEGRDVVAVLPTGFGKSLIFQMFACVKKFGEEQGCVLVVCPLKSIIADQIDEANALKLKAVELVSPEILEQQVLPDLLFASAKAVSSKEFRATLKKRALVHLVVVDESHTIETWTGER
jgi:ATP-dependent DNA helicase RecQ